MPILVKRKVFKVGEGSFAVTLPKAWVSYKQLKYGDTVEIVANDDIIIRAKTNRRKVDRRPKVSTYVIP